MLYVKAYQDENGCPSVNDVPPNFYRWITSYIRKNDPHAHAITTSFPPWSPQPNAQSGAIVPDSVSATPQTRVEAEYAGIRYSPMPLNVAETLPGPFAADFSGRGQGPILNEDGTSNSVANRARRDRSSRYTALARAIPGCRVKVAASFPRRSFPFPSEIGGVAESDIFCMPPLRRPKWRAHFGSTCGRRREHLPEINP